MDRKVKEGKKERHRSEGGCGLTALKDCHISLSGIRYLVWVGLKTLSWKSAEGLKRDHWVVLIM